MALTSAGPAWAPSRACGNDGVHSRAIAALSNGNGWRQQQAAVVDGRRRQRRHVAAAAGGGEPKGNLGDELLDFMYAGKKLRKWYGQEGQVLPRDGRPGPSDQQEDEEEPAVREYIAVLDADSSPMAEQVVLQLILNRAKIRALVKDAPAAKSGFGPYIEAVQGDANDAATLSSGGPGEPPQDWQAAYGELLKVSA
ncbi:hypothetical protein COHA_006807 [Chlorella ohadii]|uniref:Uncharacterized protein n=1 Tax=Chlorella ohadii TaxID=2649997 RepID=A0AAD5H0E6_9CHLO|nr:hypothetical protein COHA_006807 [Chlorella ohadii]